MTDPSEFESAFAEFRAMPYPPYPQLVELQDWNSRLLVIDGHVAGYASRVKNGRMKARDIPRLAELILEIESLRTSLEAIEPLSSEDTRLIDGFKIYIAALQRMMLELGRLASRGQ
jgi:hypothetical protein